MLTCEQTEHLFDAYLDGELSSSLRTEVHAHRLNCHHCNHRLVLLESCADVVACDRREPTVSEDFTVRVLDRLAADPVPVLTDKASGRLPRVYRLFVPVAAAAAAVAVTVMIAPPVKHKPVDNTMVALKNPASPKTSRVSSYETGMIVDEDGGIVVVDVGPDETGKPTIRRTNVFKEVPDSLAETMIESGLKPTVQGWDRMQHNQRALRQLGSLLLRDTLGELTSEQVKGELDSGEAMPPVAPAVEKKLVPAIPQADEVPMDSASKEKLPT